MSDNENIHIRLQSLYRHLSEEGWHVHANTAALAIDLLKDDTWKIAFAAQTRKLQHVLHIPGVKEALAELGKESGGDLSMSETANPSKAEKRHEKTTRSPAHQL